MLRPSEDRPWIPKPPIQTPDSRYYLETTAKQADLLQRVEREGALLVIARAEARIAASLMPRPRRMYAWELDLEQLGREYLSPDFAYSRLRWLKGKRIDY